MTFYNLTHPCQQKLLTLTHTVTSVCGDLFYDVVLSAAPHDFSLADKRNDNNVKKYIFFSLFIF